MAEKSIEDIKEDSFIISSSPHLLTKENVHRIMYTVILALVPVIATSVYFYRLSAVILLLVCTITAVLTEYLVQRFMKKDTTAYDGSAAITGLLLALTLPPGFPVFGAVLGTVFAVAIGKQIFGGLGFNIFNPALLGRAFLQATYPVLITTWHDPVAGSLMVDVVSAATPLALMKFEGGMTSHLSLFLGNVSGSLGESSAIAVLIGGLFLRLRGYVNWKLPLGYLGSIAVVGAFFWFINPAKYPDPLFQITAGGAMLGAWFMVTDMVTSPTTPKGQWIFAIGAGALTVIIRLFGGLPEGVMYSILLMNSIVPLLNRHTRPKVFGEVRQRAAKGGARS
ncbi:Electron transport complex protein RnfD [hydrothermal vent metagenome]|uniref:Electron transport complex protein RnfD n=1 Tax=hydrothermal vent metagenome TaxID=652676 RepID=A0A3B0VWQ8_9ZZZZ